MIRCIFGLLTSGERSPAKSPPKRVIVNGHELKHSNLRARGNPQLAPFVGTCPTCEGFFFAPWALVGFYQVRAADDHTRQILKPASQPAIL